MMAGPERTRLEIGLAGLALATLLGFVGFQVVAGASPFDALYLTVITISTVGYAETIELDTVGRMVSMSVIVTGVVSVSLLVVSAAEILLEGHLQRAVEGRRMERAIAALRGHVIVCGYGRVGVHVAQGLTEAGTDFVVIDSDPEKLDRLVEAELLHVDGDATEEHSLESAGLEHAAAVVAAVNSDADNVLITLTAKGLSPGTQVIARAKVDENEGKLKRAGADRVIAPTSVGGHRIAQLLTRPTVATFLDMVSAGGVDFQLEEVPVTSGCDLVGATLRDARVRERFDCTVVAMRSGGEMEAHPAPDRKLTVGDTLVVMGAADAITNMRASYAP